MNEEQATSLLLLAEQAESGAAEAAWLDRLEAEHGRLGTALNWFLENGKAEQALRLGAALYSFWLTRGNVQEGREWLQKVLAAPGGSASVRARALSRAGMLAFRGGDETAARASFEESLKIARQVGDGQQVATTLLGLGRLVALRQGDYGAGHRLFEERLTLARELGDRQVEGGAIHCLAALARLEGDRDRATALYERSLSLHRELGDKQTVAVEQLNLGFMTYHRGDIETAGGLFAESLRSSHERADMYVMPPCLVGLAGVALKAGDSARAARMLGAANGMLQNAGLVFDPDDQVEYDRIADAVRAALGDDAVNPLVAEGHAMKVEQAVEYALKEARSGRADPSGR